MRQGDGPEQRLATFARAKGAPIGYGGASLLDELDLKPGVATLIFRASRDVALQTVDLFDIWDGEVRIDDVPVVGEQGQ